MRRVELTTLQDGKKVKKFVYENESEKRAPSIIPDALMVVCFVLIPIITILLAIRDYF